MSEKVDWKAKGWIVADPGLPENFRDLPWNELPWSTAMAPLVKVYDVNEKLIGAVVAIDLNTKRCWRAPILSEDFPEEEATPSPLQTASQRMLKAKGKKLVEVVYVRLDLG